MGGKKKGTAYVTPAINSPQSGAHIQYSSARSRRSHQWDHCLDHPLCSKVVRLNHLGSMLHRILRPFIKVDTSVINLHITTFLEKINLTGYDLQPHGLSLAARCEL